ncbi:recombinase family protein [Acidaminobacter sp.]|uniref:recombinase family protein n=1 Tax=Acidaminobacter sp. TaxID=1872102 RepID=UPI00256691CE|nr:recombinase family protein [Acidaminobacter sp.]MDK9711212.1 recombinase family protein [Acidaminobacter sp.]
MQTWKAAKYVRLSYTDDKSNESDSVQNQKKLIDDFVKNNPDIEIVSEKVDDGYSGIIFDRPAFKEMMEDVHAGKINCVIVKDLSRLGREHTETGRYLRRIFPAYGVRFIAINDNIDTAKDSSGDDLAVSLKSIMNDAYCRDISVKTRSALAAKRKNGDYIGACPIYGYRKSDENKNQLAVDEYAARVVQDIFRMKIEGASALSIANELNKQGLQSPFEYKKSNGLPCPSGGYADKDNGRWSATTIIRILQDETYTGTLLQGKQGTSNYKLKDLSTKPVSEWIRTDNAHEAIIRKHDFDLVQRIMHMDTRTAPDEDKVYLFSGILICECCGARMTRQTVPYKGIKYYYYRCTTGKKNGCNAPKIKESDLMGCVLDLVKSHVGNVVSLDELLNNTCEQNINRKLASQYLARIKENEKQLATTKKYKASLYENFVSGILSKDDYKLHKNQYAEDGERLENAILLLQQELDGIQNNTSERLRWIEHFKKFEALTALDRKAVIQLIQSIKITGKSEIEVTFRYQDEYQKAVSIITDQREAV